MSMIEKAYNTLGEIEEKEKDVYKALNDFLNLIATPELKNAGFEKYGLREVEMYDYPRHKFMKTGLAYMNYSKKNIFVRVSALIGYKGSHEIGLMRPRKRRKHPKKVISTEIELGDRRNFPPPDQSSDIDLKNPKKSIRQIIKEYEDSHPELLE